jgi:pimeloyl-ACP methyl ester carboxylesterase
MAQVEYNEFGYFHENAEEYGIAYAGPPSVRREFITMSDGRTMSALVWGDAPPRLVFLHGGAQNAHTWDTVMLALGVPSVCVDLPGHGHSGAVAPLSSSGDPLEGNAHDVAEVMRTLSPDAEAVVGMSLGGMTTIALSHHHPDLVKKMVLVDITPGIDGEKTKAITDFVNGPATFDSFDDLLERTIQFNPTRSVSSLRRGILHNALQRPDGSWVWRYRRDDAPPLQEVEGQIRKPNLESLWNSISAFRHPLMLVRGMRPQSVVSDEDEAELRRRAPHARIEHVVEAGHSVQGDAPLELATLIREFALA